MGAVTTRLDTQAKSIFDDLGYTVSHEGGEITAERKWRVVHVTPMPEPDDAPTSGRFRCFVTREGNCRELERRLQRQQLEYDWAIMGIDETGDYEVHATTVGW
ncbi:DUF7116 family protein [Halapricum desulfuricans]|uniref:Uncharacterized protein n=1 Tax=Halapricum desulfuricans TaxID=2841257 RepID=A0A897N690_9EURY|nr:hypothetical protein [Halapricum desulfuricans]QSG06555.1 Uncharacterized protein HSR121_2225 [Halapricum desulfuricans]